MTSDLKPCPFCGGTNLDATVAYVTLGDMKHLAWRVLCKPCAVSGPEAPAKSDAIDNWNCRADLRCVSVKERLPRRGRIVPACSKFFQYPCFVSDDDMWYYADGRIVESNSPILLWYDIPEPPEVRDE